MKKPQKPKYTCGDIVVIDTPRSNICQIVIGTAGIHDGEWVYGDSEKSIIFSKDEVLYKISSNQVKSSASEFIIFLLTLLFLIYGLPMLTFFFTSLIA